MSIFQSVDCIQLYVPDLEEGIKFYSEGLGLRMIWRTNTSVGLGMEGDITELVLQNERKSMEVDFKVVSVEKAVERIARLGGSLICGPFDIPIGKCAVIRDKWNNDYVILDMTKGRYVTDENGRVTGVSNE